MTDTAGSDGERPKDPAAQALGAKGGRKAWERVSAERRSEIMTQRWDVRRASGKRTRAKK